MTAAGRPIGSDSAATLGDAVLRLSPLDRRRALIVGLFWAAAAIVYGSLLPFEMRGLTFEEGLARFAAIERLNLTAGHRADWVANIILYVPLTFLLSASILHHSESVRAQLFKAVFIIGFGAGLAVAVEFAQVFFHPRTVSINDIYAESLGSIIGVVSWALFAPLEPTLRARIKAGGLDAFTTALSLYVFFYVLYAMFPFDFIVSWGELSDSLTRAIATFLTMPEDGTEPVRVIFWITTSVGAMAPIGALLRLKDLQFSPKIAFFLGFMFGGAIEFAQIFLVSGTVHFLAAPLSGVGAAVGAYAIESFARRPLWRWRELAQFSLPFAIGFYVAIAAAAYGLLGGGWGGLGLAQENFQDLKWTPFYYHYFTTELEAMRSAAERAVLFGPAGALVWAASGAPLQPRGVRAAGALAAVFAFTLESARLFKIDLRPDMTNVIIAAAAASATAYFLPHLVRWMGDAQAKYR